MIKKLFTIMLLLSTASATINASAPEAPTTPEAIRKAITDTTGKLANLTPEDPQHAKLTQLLVDLQASRTELKTIVPKDPSSFNGSKTQYHNPY